MIKIRVSYLLIEDLNDILSLLGDRVIKLEYEPAKGSYKRAYMLVKVEKAPAA